MQNIAAVVRELSVSQNSFYLIKEFNTCLDNTDLSMSVFFERPAITPVDAMFACRSIVYLSGYNGIVIATSIQDADKILKASNSSSRYLYLWDLTWLEQPVYFEKTMKVLRDPRLKIIARSESHAEAIESFCNKKPIGIVSDWNRSELFKILGVKDETNR